MKKAKQIDELRPKYKLADFKSKGVCGKYCKRIMAEGTSVVLLDVARGMTRPAPNRQVKSRVVSRQHHPQSDPRELIELARQLAKVKAQAHALGIFTNDRELLECPNCGLSEDVTAAGLLVTYPKDSVDLKDCGLRFRPVNKTRFACPKCGTRVKAEIL